MTNPVAFLRVELGAILRQHTFDKDSIKGAAIVEEKADANGPD